MDAHDLANVVADKLTRLADDLADAAKIPGPIDNRGCVRCERAHFDGFGCRDHFDPHEEPRKCAEVTVRNGRNEAAGALERFAGAECKDAELWGADVWSVASYQAQSVRGDRYDADYLRMLAGRWRAFAEE